VIVNRHRWPGLALRLELPRPPQESFTKSELVGSWRLGQGGFQVFRPALYPANDGALSLGQAWVASRLFMER